ARKWARVAEEVALSKLDARIDQGAELFRALDALGQNLCADARSESHERFDQQTACGIRLDAAREGDVELDRVRSEVEDVTKARVSRARVVDRESHASCSQRSERRREALVVQ